MGKFHVQTYKEDQENKNKIKIKIWCVAVENNKWQNVQIILRVFPFFWSKYISGLCVGNLTENI